VLHFTDSLVPSGVGQHISLLARELSSLGYAQGLVCPDTPAARPLMERCAALGLEVQPLRVRGERDKADYARLVELLRRDRFNLFHVHAGITWEGCWGAFAAAEAGVPAVWTEHLPYLIKTPKDRARRLRASRTAAYTVGVSGGVARSLVEHGVVPRDRTRVVWNGIDLASFCGPRRPELRTKLLGLDARDRLVVSVGRLTPQKRHALLLEAAALAQRREPRLVVALAGDGPLPLRRKREAQAARLGIAGRVRFLGPFRPIPDLLRCADALAQPSAFEGLPLAVLEAMATSLPVVVTDVVGSNETVVPEESGLVVPPNDPSALAEALVRVLQDPQLAGRIGAGARRRAEREFAAPAMARRTLAVYGEALAGPAGAPRPAAQPLLAGQAARQAAQATPALA
jgi:glycosyltransferase involved in cell wall biosynthesis